MISTLNLRRAVTGIALAGVMALAGCILLPGKFTSSLDLQQDGSFTFRYDGQLLFMPLNEEFNSKKETGDDVTELSLEDEWEPTCWDDDYEARECTPEEKAEQVSEREEARALDEQTKKRENDEIIRMFAGIDPKDPEAGTKIAQLLERQAGWESVTYLGDGLFDVRFGITSRLDHDFAFPTIEGMEFIQPFVRIHRRDGGAIRVNAPGYSTQSTANGMNPGLFMMAASAGGMPGMSGKDDPAIQRYLDGSFTLTTDGEILANNTDEGASEVGARRQLTWKITPATETGPTALVRIR